MTADDLVFKSLASADRRRNLDLVRVAPLATGQSARRFPGLDRATAMLHSGVLQYARLMISRKRGRFHCSYLDVAPVQGIDERRISDYTAPSAKLLASLHRPLHNTANQRD